MSVFGIYTHVLNNQIQTNILIKEKELINDPTLFDE